MRAPAPKNHKVYDFDEDDSAVEEASYKYASILEKKLDDTHVTLDPNTKKGDVTSLLCKDLHEKENEQHLCDTNTLEINVASNNEKTLDKVVASSGNNNGDMCPNDFDNGRDRRAPYVFGNSGFVTVVGNNNSYADLSSDDNKFDMISEDIDWTSASESLSLDSSDTSEDEDSPEYPISKSYDIYYENMGMDVTFCADYVIYGGTLYTESQVTFSVESVKIECSDASGLSDNLVAEWIHNDITFLGCQWSSIIDAALVKICVKTNNMIQSGIHQNDHDSVKVMFSVTMANWAETEQKIKDLAGIYKEIWNSYSSDDLMWDESIEDSNGLFQRGHFSDIAEPFEEVVYPKGDPDAVSLSARDFELLQPDTFLNDTIIDFYIKYLKNKIPSDDRHRFHFFNSFFFRKLADLDKERGSASDGRSAFLRVRKWTRKVNIFEKDYIFIPVNFNLHWSLLIICHPGEIMKMKDVELKDSPKLPCVLHMDSIKGTHSGVKSIVQSYIWEEWKERHPGWPVDDSTNFLTLRFVPLELPQQENSTDCGLFLLHYVELFLEQAPLNFNPFMITKFSTYLTADWFQPSEASLKRSLIRNLICELLNESSRQDISPACTSYLSFPRDEVKNIKLEPIKETLPEHCEPVDSANGDTSSRGLPDCIEQAGVQQFINGEPTVSPLQHLESSANNSTPQTVVMPTTSMDASCTNLPLLVVSVGGECNHSLDEQCVVKPCALASPQKEDGLENPVNSTEEKGADRILHDTSNVKLMDIGQATDAQVPHKPEIVESVHENNNSDASETGSSKIESESEYSRDGFIAQVNECLEMPLPDKTRDFDDQKSLSHFALQDVATADEALSDEVQLIGIVDQQPKKRRKHCEVNRRRTRSFTRIMEH